MNILEILGQIFQTGLDKYLLENLPVDIKKKCAIHDRLIKKIDEGYFDAVTAEELGQLLRSNNTYQMNYKVGKPATTRNTKWLNIIDITD